MAFHFSLSLSAMGIEETSQGRRSEGSVRGFSLSSTGQQKCIQDFRLCLLDSPRLLLLPIRLPFIIQTSWRQTEQEEEEELGIINNHHHLPADRSALSVFIRLLRYGSLMHCSRTRWVSSSSVAKKPMNVWRAALDKINSGGGHSW